MNPCSCDPRLPVDDSAIFDCGDYLVMERLGQGGVACVHRAKRKADGTHLALKLLMKRHFLDPMARTEMLLRFSSEADCYKQLSQCEGIIQVQDSGEILGGTSFIAMELLSGGSLDDHKHQFIGQYSRAASIIASAARALAYAHSLGVVHRDLKPSNLMFRTADKNATDVVVTDFGFAVNYSDTLRLTQTGAFMGTPVFASPEQLMDTKHVGEATDVFALGVTLYYLMSGALPFPMGGNTLARYRLQRQHAVAPPLASTLSHKGLPPCDIDLCNACHRCLTAVDQGRIASAEALAEELEEHA